MCCGWYVYFSPQTPFLNCQLAQEISTLTRYTTAILHHGQVCFSTERIIVHKAIADPFTTHLATAFSNIPSAGHAVHKQSADHAIELLREAQEKGAKILAGGIEYLSETSLKPTLITGVTKDMRIADEETFGPSAALYVAKDDDDAVRLANDTVYGLNAAVHSRSWEHAYEVGKQLEFGQVHINNVTCTDSRKFFLSCYTSLAVASVMASVWAVFVDGFG